MLNKCDHGQNCIFSHKVAIPQPHQNKPFFRQVPTTRFHSPRMQNMSQHIQNIQQVQSTHVKTPIPSNIIELIPQIVSQVILALTA